ncbi:MAG TPA: hypothetical protein VKX17_11645 [Planctomycetota bacterium]|nr:hypothetical protein [Planctomycetota bacterium]
MKKILLTIIVSVSACGVYAGQGGQNNPDKAADQAAAAAVDAAAQRLDPNAAPANPRNMTPDERKKAAAQKKEDIAELKAKTKENLDQIKALFQMAENAWKAKNYKQAGNYYLSVSKATVPGSEDMVATSLERVNSDMEKLAKDLIAQADDADMQRDFMKEIELLSNVSREFDITHASKDGYNKLTSLKSKPEVAGFVEYAQAEAQIADGKLTDAMTTLNAIINNPRYEHSIPALKANKLMEKLNKDEETRGQLKKEFLAKADQKAPQMLLNAKNCIVNNMPKQAKEILSTVVDKFPDTPYAEEAKKQMETLASGK